MKKQSILGKHRKKIIITFAAILIICMVLIIEINIFHNGFCTAPQKADVIIVLGCAVWGENPSPTLKQRIYKAAELYRLGYAKKIIASGGKGPGENLAEAEAIKKWLSALGVPKEKIIEEKKSANTFENLKFCKEIMERHNLKNSIIVTNYFHIYRSSMIAKDLKISASFGKADMPKSKINLLFSNLREVLSVLKYFTLKLFEKFKIIF